MIKFFRKIRQKMLTENKFSKYLIYAIGEIILVVIGILIALQINNWNQNRQDRNQEKQILVQLQKEYISNLKQIQSKIFIRKEIIKSSFKLLNYKSFDKKSINLDSLNLKLSHTITRPTFDPELGVSNELSNSGKLYLLTNSELRIKIAAFPSFLSELREEEMVIFNWIEMQLIPFYIEHYQMGGIHAGFLDDEKIRSELMLVNFQKEKSLKELFEVGDIDQLLSHSDFEDHLSKIISSNTYTNDQSIGVKNKIEEIIYLIKNEIEK